MVPGSFLYKSWANMSVDLFSEFYLFNLENSIEFENYGKKPVFKEIGPFVYKEVRYKENIVSNGNGTITYRERRRFFFVPELSSYPENYSITTINMGAITAITFAQYWNSFSIAFLNIALKISGETLLIKQPAGKLLFGYEDPFLKILRSLDEKLIPNDKISFFFNVRNMKITFFVDKILRI